MEQEKLAKIKENLLGEKRRLEEQIANMESTHALGDELREVISEFSSYDNHPADLGSETFERGKDIALRDHTEQILHKVQDAVGKIDAGEYGKCDNCGREIGIERLEALPYASQCIDCESENEKIIDRQHRPVEEGVLYPPFGRTFTYGTDNVVFDGEDSWQSVARYGNSETPQDVPGATSYDDMYVDADENIGIVQSIERYTATDDIDTDEEDVDNRC